MESIKRNSPLNIPTHDILILTETFATKEIDLQGYYGTHSLATQGEAGRPSGGVSCYFKPTLAPIRILQKTTNTITVQTKLFTVIASYYQPGFQIENIIEELNEALAKAEDNPILLAGDYNCRTDKRSHKTELLLEYLQEEGFELINNPKHPTYICHNGSSTIDLVFLNSRMKAMTNSMQSTIIQLPYRKHLPVLTTIETKTITKPNPKQPQGKIGRQLDLSKVENSKTEIRNIKEIINEGKSKKQQRG